MYAVIGAQGRVNVASYWSTNFLRGVGCNWLVGLAYFLAVESKDQVSKIYSIWIPIWAFVGLGFVYTTFIWLWNSSANPKAATSIALRISS
jgi:formate/nitrite transporter FocA (FNT family)